jgi:hypothetical protein
MKFEVLRFPGIVSAASGNSSNITKSSTSTGSATLLIVFKNKDV